MQLGGLGVEQEDNCYLEGEAGASLLASLLENRLLLLLGVVSPLPFLPSFFSFFCFLFLSLLPSFLLLSLFLPFWGFSGDSSSLRFLPGESDS